MGSWTRTGEIVKRGRYNLERCVCSCGRKESFVQIGNGNVLSSNGCRHCATEGNRQKKHWGGTGNPTHGHASGPANARKSITYIVWTSIKARCLCETQPGYEHYGAKGITVCERWLHSFENFLADMGERPSAKYSIDRYPNQKGNYEPGNCRWATSTEQNRNRSSNVILTILGESMTMVEWSERTGMKMCTISKRIKKGWSHESAVFAPVMTNTATSKMRVNNRRVEYNGETLIAAEWARRIGIPNSTVIHRLGQGWDIGRIRDHYKKAA